MTKIVKFVEKIRRLLGEAGDPISQYKLAKLLGTSSTAIQQYEKERSNRMGLPILCRLRRVARLDWVAFGKLLDDEFFDIEKPSK